MPTRRELANVIRALSTDAVRKANSGHPGAPMGLADIAEVLWRDVLKFNPGNPGWSERDRFVLSNGHASMLLYGAMRCAWRRVRLVSMPSTTTFNRQEEAYRHSVLPPSVTRRVAGEAGARDSWWRYVGLNGQILGIDHYGASAPAKELFKHFGFTADHLVQAIEYRR